MKTREQPDMIQSIDDLIRLLETDPVTLEQAAATLGTIAVDHGDRAALELKPFDTRFRTIELFRQPGTRSVYSVDLVPADDQTLTVDELGKAFGPYEDASSTHFDVPREIIIYVDHGETTPYTVALIAKVPVGTRDLGPARVLEITLRRDPR